MKYEEAVKKAKHLLGEVKKADRYYWDLAELSWQQVKEKGVKQTKWAEDIGLTQGTVALYLKAHDKYISHEIKPPWAQAYAEAKYPNAEREEGERYTSFESRQRAKTRVHSMPITDQVEVASKLLANEEVQQRVLAQDPELPVKMMQTKHSIDRTKPKDKAPKTRKADVVDSTQAVTFLIAARDQLRNAFSYLTSSGSLNDAQRSLAEDWLKEIHSYEEQIRTFLRTGGWDESFAQMQEGEVK